MTTLATRYISGRGLLLVDTENSEFKNAKVLTLYADVIRYPYNEYDNRNYNPSQSRYATLVFLKNDYVVDTQALTYSRQSWTFAPEISSQNLYAIQCAYAGILETFFNLGNALSLPSISLTDHIKDWRHIDLFWDTVKVVCYADTAIRLVLEAIPYDLCEEQESPTPTPPPPEPPFPPPVEPGQSLNNDNYPVSPPYDDGNDNGDTSPYPDDSFPPAPGEDVGDTVDGNLYTVYIQFKQFPGGSVLTRVLVVWGGVGGARLNPANATQLQLYCKGIAGNPFSPTPPNPSVGWVLVETLSYDTAVDVGVVGVDPV